MATLPVYNIAFHARCVFLHPPSNFLRVFKVFFSFEIFYWKLTLVAVKYRLWILKFIYNFSLQNLVNTAGLIDPFWYRILYLFILEFFVDELLFLVIRVEIIWLKVSKYKNPMQFLVFIWILYVQSLNTLFIKKKPQLR